VLLKNSKVINQYLFTCLARSPFFFEIKIYLVEKFMETMDYNQLDKLIESIECHFQRETSENILANNCNPILIAVLLLNFLDNIKETYLMFEFRIKAIKDVLNDHCRRVLVNLYMPKEIRAQVKQRDLFNHNALFYMEKLDSFKLLDSKVMDRIMKDYWNSNVDASGSFFACSTCYNILTQSKLSHNEDYES